MDKKLTICMCSALFIFIVLPVWPVSAEQMTCEQAREKLIAPLREAKINECKSDPEKDPAWCELYYSTYGDAAANPRGKVSARMFDDIPECEQEIENK